MKKRKVTKASLKELAKMLPVLTEKEMRKAIGRSYYYSSSSGYFLGKLGDGNEIRLVDPSVFSSLQGCNDDSELYPMSSSLESASLSVKEGVMRSMAIQIGYSGNVYMSDAHPDNNGSYSLESGIGINQNSALFGSGNYYDFLLLLYHEKHHSETMGDAGSARSEYEAYSAMVSRPEFQYASPSYKQEILDNVEYYKNKMEMEEL